MFAMSHNRLKRRVMQIRRGNPQWRLSLWLLLEVTPKIDGGHRGCSFTGMAHDNGSTFVLCACAVTVFTLAGESLRADDSPATREELRQVKEENRALQEQLRQQQMLIESLSRKVNQIEKSDSQRNTELESEMKDGSGSTKRGANFSLGQVSLSAEGGAAFFNTGSKGAFPNSEFRLDEARLFVEAPVFENVYFFSEINLMTREAENLSVQLGETYIDFENVSQLWNRDRMLNLRLGRMYIPFGEEYLSRYAIDNPLISHSLPDIWGVDEGIELYGKIGKVSYALAVQNGGPSGVRDFNGDKSVSGRLSFDPNNWLHLSASGLRTGDLQRPGDYWSELWFGNGWFYPFGSTNANLYHANLVEGDVEIRLPHGHLKVFGGYARFDDNDPRRVDRRDIFYYSVEGVHDLTHKLFGAARFSQILADKGIPIVGNGALNTYFYGPTTTELLRLSLGLGYRFSQNLIFKGEYSFERGRLVTGQHRDHEDLFALEAAFRF